jgi:uncharacterized membrane protein
MVLLRSALGAMLLTLSVPPAVPDAFAGEGEITFCNEFPHKVYVAIAYLQTDVNNHLARGWLNVETGKCYVFDTAIRVQTFYYRAESDTYKDGKDKVKMNWGKGQKFAIRDNSFQTYNTEGEHSGMKQVEFSKGPESSGGPLTCTVTFLADGKSMTVVPAPGGANRAAPKGGSDEQPATSAPSGAPSEATPAPTAPSAGGEDRN